MTDMALTDPEAALSMRVYYEDTDASGVAYHTSYLRWMERARTEWMRARGGDHRAFMSAQGVAFTLSRVDVNFVAPARLDDLVEVHTQVTRLRRASIDFTQTVQIGTRTLASANVRVACVDAASFRPAALPSSIAPQRNSRA
jgi:acyl-CoA thioester hydrolase